jgi:hypothetical protein
MFVRVNIVRDELYPYYFINKVPEKETYTRFDVLIDQDLIDRLRDAKKALSKVQSEVERVLHKADIFDQI